MAKTSEIHPEYGVAPQPDMRLYVDASSESQQAFQVLAGKSLTAEIIQRAHDVPMAEFDGLNFHGLEAISKMATILRTCGNDVVNHIRRTRPDIVSKGNPAYGEWVRGIRTQQMNRARQVMQEIIDKPTLA